MGAWMESCRRSSRTVAVRVAAVAVALVGLVTVADAGAASACDRLWIASVELERCVVSGGQGQIDAGNVVRMDALSSGHLHWLAGHRTSHGGTFEQLPSMSIGAGVDYRGTTYRVDEYRLVDRHRPDVMDWLGSSAEALVLQTSAQGVYVHVWHAVPVEPDPTQTLRDRMPVEEGPAEERSSSRLAARSDVAGYLSAHRVVRVPVRLLR